MGRRLLVNEAERHAANFARAVGEIKEHAEQYFGQLEKLAALKDERKMDIENIDLVDISRAIVSARASRSKVLPSDILAGPSYDMLLHAFVSYNEGRRVTISAMSTVADNASTTGLRWIAVLEGRGFFTRELDDTDRRKVYMSLSPKGVAMVTKMLRAEAAAFHRALQSRSRRE